MAYGQNASSCDALIPTSYNLYPYREIQLNVFFFIYGITPNPKQVSADSNYRSNEESNYHKENPKIETFHLREVNVL